jgi:hypothetical protein
MKDFTTKQYFKDPSSNFKGTGVEEAFGVYYSKQILFAAEVNSPKVIYH